jgi:hypothetical protein
MVQILEAFLFLIEACPSWTPFLLYYKGSKSKFPQRTSDSQPIFGYPIFGYTRGDFREQWR